MKCEDGFTIELIAQSNTKVPYPQHKWSGILHERLHLLKHKKARTLRKEKNQVQSSREHMAVNLFKQAGDAFWSIRNQTNGGIALSLSNNLLVRLLFYTGITAHEKSSCKARNTFSKKLSFPCFWLPVRQSFSLTVQLSSAYFQLAWAEHLSRQHLHTLHPRSFIFK